MGRIYVGDRNSFVWQWQPKEQIVLEDYPEGVFVHYANCDTVEAPVVQSRMEGEKLVADIPPELMQSDKDITVYVCDADGTKHCHFLAVLSRPKPESYVTEPVEVLRYESLAERVKKLEEEGTGGGGGSCDCDPAYVASDEPPEDVGVLWVDTSERGEAVALGVAAEETPEGVVLYCTDELGTTTALVRHGKDGAPGKTPAKGVDYLTPDDVAEIAEQAAGMVEVPGAGGGGSSGWDVIMETTLEQEAEIHVKNLIDVKEAFVGILVPPYPDGDEQNLTSSGHILGVNLNGVPVRRKEKAVVLMAHVWVVNDKAHGWISGGTSNYNPPDWNDPLTGVNQFRAAGKNANVSQIALNWDYPPGTYAYIAVRR